MGKGCGVKQQLHKQLRKAKTNNIITILFFPGRKMKEETYLRQCTNLIVCKWGRSKDTDVNRLQLSSSKTCSSRVATFVDPRSLYSVIQTHY